MKTSLFVALLAACVLIGPLTAHADQSPPQPVASCAPQIPYGMPSDQHPNTVIICRHAYIVQSDTVAKIPVWVSYTLTPEHTVGCVKRSNAFEADESLPDNEVAKKEDYAKNGYDIGHQANDADMDWDVTVERESFILTNMAPQYPALNRGIWKVLETYVRAWAHAGHSLTIYVGPIWSSTDPVIGTDKVVAAGHFYKIITDQTTKQSLAFIMSNLKIDQGDDVSPFQTTVADIESKTGIQFSVPGSKTVKNTIWVANTEQLEVDKKAACKK